MKQAIKFNNTIVLAEFKENKVIKVYGDRTLSDIIRGLFREPIDTTTGYYDEGVMHTELITLNPGDTGYVEAVLYDRIQDHGMQLVSVEEFDNGN